MDISRLAQEVLAFAGEKGLVREDWGEWEGNLQTLLRQIGQEVLQQSADASPRRGYEGSSRGCSCGKEQRFVQHRSRTIETLFGPLRYARAYYHCAACGRGFYPFDQAQGLSSRQVSVGLARALVELAEALPFRQAADKLQKLLGLTLSASTINRISQEVGGAAAEREREAAEQVEADRRLVGALEAGRLYNYADGAMVHRLDGWHEVKALQCRWQDEKGRWHARHLCRNEEAESFAKLAWACMHVCGLDNARQSVLCGDGIPWIWNHLGPIADEAVQILDWYHAREHLWKLAQSLHGEATPQCQAMAESLERLLWESRQEELFALLDRERLRLRSKSRRSAIDELVGYLERHRSRIDYKKYREQGLLIGSGPIEGDCKNLIHARMKRGSPRWSKEGCQSMLSLRCCYANGEQRALWNRKPLLAA